MDVGRILAIFRQNTRLLLRDPGPIVVFILTPLLVMAIIKPTQDIVLANRGFPDANGSEQVVPGFTVMFSFFWILFIGRNFFAEHGWGTWERLQASVASAGDIMVGKLLPAFVVIAIQMVVLFTVGGIVFNLDSKGNPAVLAVVAVPLILTVLSLTLMLVAICRSLTQIDAIGNLLMMVFAALGGSLAPIYVLPSWAEKISPITPSYWAVKASDQVILDGKGLMAVLPSAGVLMGFAVLFAAIAASRFSFAEGKVIEA